MLFKQFVTRESSLSYLVGSREQGEAVAVDVLAGDEDWLLREAEALGVKITWVVDTHIHADHYSGGRTLAEKTGARYALHESNLPKVGFAFTALQAGQYLELGQVALKVLHTPGHTPDSIALLVTDRERSGEPVLLLSGDTWLVGAVGRPDLAGREQPMAEALYDSLHQQLLPLPDFVELYPAHFAGSVCGAGISHKLSSTLGYEKRANRSFLLSRDAFIQQLLGSLPPKPVEIERIVSFNRGQEAEAAPQASFEAEAIPRVDPLAIREQLVQEQVWVIDVREDGEFAAGHIPGALSFPLSRLNPLTLPLDRPLVLSCQVGQRTLIAAQRLFEAGIRHFSLLEGSLLGWKKAGLPVVV